jgi:hypothetical protein
MMAAQTFFLRYTISQQVLNDISVVLYKHAYNLVLGCFWGSSKRSVANLMKSCYNFGISEWNATAYLVNTASAVREVTVDCNKRPASIDFPDTVDCKRMKQEDQSKTC